MKRFLKRTVLEHFILAAFILDLLILMTRYDHWQIPVRRYDCTYIFIPRDIGIGLESS